MITLQLDDPLTRTYRNRIKRQRQALFNLSIGLVLGGSISFLVIELVKGVLS